MFHGLQLHRAAAIVASLFLASFGDAQTLASEIVAEGLTRPVFVTAPEGDYGRLFVVEQRDAADIGHVRIVDIADNDTLLATPFLSVGPLADDSEQGLLGLAFDPGYDDNGFFYVHYTAPNDGTTPGPIVIARYQRSAADPNLADPNSGVTIMTFPHPFRNHNGGWIAFGPDGYLYMSSGDGGDGNDPQGNGQSLTTRLGKILRIDVHGDDFPADPDRNYAIPPTNPFVGTAGDDEIWAYGLRNPWRCSFDRDTGDLWIADVGQGFREEVDFQAANDPGALPGQPGYQGGRNYGWRCMEGTRCSGLSGCTCNAASLALPVMEYGHTIFIPPWNLAMGCAVTGGYVYRGCAIPSLRGHYFFADFCNREIYSFPFTLGQVPAVTARRAQLDPPGPFGTQFITSFGEDAMGEMYFCIQGGAVFRVIEASPSGPDCNENGRPDGCDILTGDSDDGNGNGIPDECECDADFDGDGFVTGSDFDAYVTAFEAGEASADFDGDGFVTGLDFDAFVAAFEAGC